MAQPAVGMAELVERWTLVGDEHDLVSGKRGATRLGFALLLKFYTAYGRFPRGRSELADEVVEHVAGQVGVPASEIGFYAWSGSTHDYHRKQIRDHLGFRECSVADANKLADWLAVLVAHAERDADKVRVELLKEMREQRIEPPTDGRVGRIVASGLAQAEKAWFTTIGASVGDGAAIRALALVGWGAEVGADEDGEDVFAGPEAVWSLIRAAPGRVSLESLLTETRKLVAVRTIGVPPTAFADVPPKVLTGWRTQCAMESPSHLRRRGREAALTLICSLLHERQREITDDLTGLLMATVHRIDARAHKKVTDELVNAFKKVDGKENLLFRIADAALAEPDGIVSKVVFGAVAGGEQTLRELVHEYKTKGPVYRRTVRTMLKASYTNHYRRGMIDLLDVLEFGSTIDDHPVLAALDYIKRHAKASGVYYPIGDAAPRHKGTDGDWAELAFCTDARGKTRTVRQAYEVATFRTLRELLSCKEIWVVGAGRYRNPDEDLPGDYEARRVDYYAELRKPLDPKQFVAELRGEMETELAALNDALPNLGCR